MNLIPLYLKQLKSFEYHAKVGVLHFYVHDVPEAT